MANTLSFAPDHDAAGEASARYGMVLTDRIAGANCAVQSDGLFASRSFRDLQGGRLHRNCCAANADQYRKILPSAGERIDCFSGGCMKAYDGIYNRYVKRVIDLIVALPFAVAALPIYLVVSIAIVLEDGFPVFYRPKRGGYKNKPFRIFKFRTMVKNADQIGGGTTAMHDPRITKVGAVLRKTKLDETANLINILLGTMSFIGPRPELLRYTDKYEGAEKEILEVRPGVTDFSSIEFINLDEIVGSGNADEMYEKHVLKKKNALRIKYAESVSMKTDCVIFFKTIWKVLEKAFAFLVKKEHR